MNPKEEKHCEEPTDDGGRISPKTRAYFWLASAVVVFVCAVVMCLTLIGKSADRETSAISVLRPNSDSQTDNPATTNPSGDDPATLDPSGDDPETTDAPQTGTEPESVYQSSTLNILLIGYDEETSRTDTLVILSIHKEDRTVAMLSIPRDTYISGGFAVEKINRVYAERGKRGLASLKEQIENMIGFKLDYYVLFDADSMEKITELTGAISFDVPSDPDYHGLKSGTQELSGADAFELFRFNESYTDVETEPYFVQRDFLAAILDTLLSDPSTDCDALCEAVQTDLTAENLVYLGNLLKNFRFSADSTFSRALPGGEITVNGVDYYEVNIEKAVQMLNEHFNPLPDDLTEYDVIFRQKQAGSGEGETSPWGFTSSTDGETEPTEDETPYESETGESDEPTESSSQDEEPTEPSTDSQEPPETEPPTETQPPETSGGDDE